VNAPLRIAIAGAAGRMGRTLVEAVQEQPAMALSAALEAPGNALLGADAGSVAGVGESGIRIGDDREAAVKGCDVPYDVR